MGTAVKEAIFLWQMCKELGMDFTPITIYGDNQSALAIAKNPVFHSRQKHVDIQYHFIREEVERGRITFKYCQTKEMVADICTKPISRDQFRRILNLLKLQ